MVAGREYVSLDANLNGLVGAIAALEKEPHRRERMSEAATQFVRTYLSEEAVECYVLRLLIEYAKLYKLYRGPCAAAERDAASEEWVAQSGVASNVLRERKPGCHPPNADPCIFSWSGVHRRPANETALVQLPPLEFEFSIN